MKQQLSVKGGPVWMHILLATHTQSEDINSHTKETGI